MPQLNTNLNVDYTNSALPTETTINEFLTQLLQKNFPKRKYLVKDGILQSGYSWTQFGNIVTITQNTGYITLGIPGNAGGVGINVDDVSSYSKLCLSGRTQNYGDQSYLGYSGHFVAPYVGLSNAIFTHEIPINSSSIVASIFGAATNHSIYVYDLWLE